MKRSAFTSATYSFYYPTSLTSTINKIKKNVIMMMKKKNLPLLLLTIMIMIKIVSIKKKKKHKIDQI